MKISKKGSRKLKGTHSEVKKCSKLLCMEKRKRKYHHTLRRRKYYERSFTMKNVCPLKQDLFQACLVQMVVFLFENRYASYDDELNNSIASGSCSTIVAGRFIDAKLLL